MGPSVDDLLLEEAGLEYTLVNLGYYQLHLELGIFGCSFL